MKNFVALACIAFVITSCKDQPSGNGMASSYETNLAVYKQALQNKDFATQAVVLNYILLDDSTNLEYKDSLACLYLRSSNFEAGLKLSEPVMAKYPDNYHLLELVALAQGYQGKYIESLKNLKKLHEEVGDITYVFMMAQMYVEQQNYDMALQKLDEVLADSGTGYFDAAASAGTQRVDIKAGAYYFKAQEALSKAQGLNDPNYNRGITFLKQALAIQPDYEAALLLAQNVQAAVAQSAYQQQGARPSGQSGGLSQDEIKRLKAIEDQKRYEQYMKQKQGN